MRFGMGAFKPLAVFLFISVLIPVYSFAGQVNVGLSFPATVAPAPVQSISGGADVQTIDTQVSTQTVNETVSDLLSNIILEVPVVAPAAKAAPAGAKPKQAAKKAVPKAGSATSIGVGVLFSTHIKVYKIPISYTINEQWKIGVTIPYVEKTLEGRFGGIGLQDSGLGDVSGNVRYTYTGEIIRLVSSLFVKFPTGNNRQFENGRERLALGTGAYDYILDESLVLKIPSWENFRILAGINGRYNGQSDYTERSTISSVTDRFFFRNQQGHVLAGFAGLVYFTPIPRLLVYGNVAGMQIFSGREKFNNPSGSVSVDRKLDDSLGTIDFVGGIKFQFSKKSALRLGAIVPVSTKFDSDVQNTSDREVLVDFGVDYVF